MPWYSRISYLTDIVLVMRRRSCSLPVPHVKIPYHLQLVMLFALQPALLQLFERYEPELIGSIIANVIIIVQADSWADRTIMGNRNSVLQNLLYIEECLQQSPNFANVPGFTSKPLPKISSSAPPHRLIVESIFKKGCKAHDGRCNGNLLQVQGRLWGCGSAGQPSEYHIIQGSWLQSGQSV
jgi:hypothetical protein